jgi:hypothetical protein
VLAAWKGVGPGVVAVRRCPTRVQRRLTSAYRRAKAQATVVMRSRSHARASWSIRYPILPGVLSVGVPAVPAGRASRPKSMPDIGSAPTNCSLRKLFERCTRIAFSDQGAGYAPFVRGRCQPGIQIEGGRDTSSRSENRTWEDCREIWSPGSNGCGRRLLPR